jgi:phage repressor protein C with HTH and peptisase S24 domain
MYQLIGIDTGLPVCNTRVFHIGDVIRKLRTERGLDQRELAKMAGVSVTTLSELERGEGNKTIGTIAKVATALGTSVEQLHLAVARGQMEELSNEYWSRSSETVEAVPSGEDVSGYTPNQVPVIAEGDASPQPNLFWGDDGMLLSDVEDRISRPYDVNDPRAYGVRVRGESMAPTYRPGMLVVVSPNTPPSDGDEVYVQLLSGERLLKVARKLPGNAWLLESHNPSFPPRLVQPEEIGAMHPVMWSRRKTTGKRVVALRIDRPQRRD